LDNIFRVATVVQQIMTKLNDTVLEEDERAAITKVVSKLTINKGH